MPRREPTVVNFPVLARAGSLEQLVYRVADSDLNHFSLFSEVRLTFILQHQGS